MLKARAGGWRPFLAALMLAGLLCSVDVRWAGAATLFQQVDIASSPNPVGSGARALGMGGAFIAVADDATASSWNPAGLIQLERPELSIVGAAFWRTEEFSSKTRPAADNRSRVDERSLNYLSASFPFRAWNRHWVVSANYQRLYEFKRDFSHEVDFSPSGLDLALEKHFEQDGYLGAFGLATAIQLSPRIALGVTLNLWTDALGSDNGWKDAYTETGTGSQGGVPLTAATEATDRYSSFRGVNANLGLLWDINSALTLGAVLKTPFKADIDHEFRFRSTTTVDTAPAPTVTTSEIRVDDTVHLRMPLSYGLGLALRVSDALSFDLDVYRTHWSDYRLTDGDGNSFSPIDGRPKGESNVKDTTQIRFGGEYLWIGSKTVIPLRAGVFYDPEPSEDSVQDFYGVAAGTGLVYGPIAFDLAYQYRWGRDVDTGNLIATTRADVDQHTVYGSVILHF
jgi:long-subunit fatty acid transport protein